jgi:hypothetical protein
MNDKEASKQTPEETPDAGKAPPPTRTQVVSNLRDLLKDRVDNKHKNKR